MISLCQAEGRGKIMPQLEWLAATLSPADIAPHPNFFSSEHITEASIFALVCSARWSDVERAKDSVPELDLTVIYATRDAFTSGESQSGADRLAEVVRTWSQDGDPAKYAALTLVASATYCELDLYQAAFDLLGFVIAKLEPDRSADNDLLLAALYQQLAMRQYDYGVDSSYIQSATQARAKIDSIERESLSSFPLSQGVDWSSSATLNDICNSISRASQSLLLNVGGFSPDSWQELVRSRPTYLDLKALQGKAEALSKFLDDAFEARLPSGTITFGRSTAENEVFSTLLSEELLGDPSVRSTRNELGTLRFLVGVANGEAWHITEAINLLRQGHGHARLRAVVNHVLNAGPLSALTECAVRIIDRRDPASFSLGELIVLHASADQLDPKTASSYFPQISQMFRHPETFTLQQLALKEEAFITAAEFANVAESPTGFARSMLELFQHLRGQQLYERAIVRALYAYDVSKATKEEKTLWTTWLDEEHARELPELASMISLMFNSEFTPGPQQGRVDTLQSVASYVDRWLRYGRQIPAEIIDDATPILIGSMRNIQEDAHKGRFSAMSIDVAAAAVALAQYSGRPEFWGEIASFLSDPSIQRDDTRQAFELIANNPTSAPEIVRDKLRANRNAILYTTPENWSSLKISPYPAALNCYTSTQIMDLPAVLTEISALAGSGMEMARAAACGALSAYISHVDAQSIWVSVLALQLSRDPSAVVRARAGRVLAALLRSQSDLRSLIISRVDALLGEDGIAVPINLLRELSSPNSVLDSQLVSRVQQLSSGSVSARIRKSAHELLGRQQSSS
jgi:hypothetical protein